MFNFFRFSHASLMSIFNFDYSPTHPSSFSRADEHNIACLPTIREPARALVRPAGQVGEHNEHQWSSGGVFVWAFKSVQIGFF